LGCRGGRTHHHTIRPQTGEKPPNCQQKIIRFRRQFSAIPGHFYGGIGATWPEWHGELADISADFSLKPA
jgi:hypothetical protein